MLFKTRHANKQLPPSFFGQKDHIINKPTCQKKNNLFTTSIIKTLKEEEKDKRCLCVCLLLWVIYYVKVIFVFIQSLISFGCLESGFWHTQALIEFAVSSSKAHEVKSGWAVGETRERKMPYSLNKDIEVNLVKVSVRKKI